MASLAKKREATSPLLIANPDAQPRRERLRHLVMGSPVLLGPEMPSTGEVMQS
ncbi:MAG: hypothetical protein WBG38_12075 [Nodosilinea sp.]